MEYPAGQIEELKRYCAKLSALFEAGINYFLMEELRLPAGCDPSICNGLLCPVPRDNYPSRLFLSVQVKCPYDRNWNVTNVRIGEANWFAFSWKVELTNPSLGQLLRAHLTGFTKPK